MKLGDMLFLSDHGPPYGPRIQRRQLGSTETYSLSSLSEPRDNRVRKKCEKNRKEKRSKVISDELVFRVGRSNARASRSEYGFIIRKVHGSVALRGRTKC